jgi:hypothetical protein
VESTVKLGKNITINIIKWNDFSACNKIGMLDYVDLYIPEIWNSHSHETAGYTKIRKW